MASTSIAIRSSPSTTSNGTASRPLLDGRPSLAGAGLEPGAAEHEGPVVLVLELLLGVDPSGDGHVARRARLGERERASHRHDRGRGEDAADAGAAAERSQEDPADPEQREADQDQEDGDHAGMIAAGTAARSRRAARRDPAGISGESSPKEPTRRVGVDVIAAVSIARPLRAAIHAIGGEHRGSMGLSTHDRPNGSRVVHRRSTATAAQVRRGQPALRPVSGSSARTWPSKLVSTRRPPTSSTVRDDVGVRHPPGDLAVGLERERLDLGLDDDVGEARRAERRRGSAWRDRWLQRSVAGRAPRTRRRGSRTSRRAGPRCPTACPRARR